MNTNTLSLSQRERELAAIITAYSEVTDQLRGSHERLNDEVRKLRCEIESKNLELARRERLAALGEMATGVAHEIRNPLGSIQLYASLLERDLKALPESQRLASKISRGVDSLELIVGDILDFAGHRGPDLGRVMLAAAIGGAVDAAEARARRKNVAIDIDATVTDVEVCVDRAQMERVILNVLLNAIDASPEDARVTVRAVQQPGGVDLQISDQGPGIPQEVMERIFNPFFTTKDTGTGLGLAIVHRVLESHGGSVRVTQAEQGGACFTMHIPNMAPTGA